MKIVHVARIVPPLTLGVAIFLVSLLSIVFVKHGAAFALIWPANALAVAALIRWKISYGPIAIGYAVSLGGILIANLATGMSMPLSLAFTLANGLEIMVASAIIRRQFGPGTAQPSQQARTVWRLLVASITGPFASALVGAAGLWLFTAAPFAMAAAYWWLSGSLSMMVVLALALAFDTRRWPRPKARQLLVAAIVAVVAPVAVTWLAFLSGRVVFLIATAPLIFFAAIRYRTNGAIAAILAVGGASMALVADSSVTKQFLVWSNPAELVALIQVYLVVEVVLSLAIANLLDERDALTAALRRQKQLATSQSEGRRSLLMNIAHDIRTPLGVITGGMELLQFHERPGHAQNRIQLVAAVASASNQLQALASDLLDMSSVESGRIPIDPEKFSVRSVLEDVIAGEAIVHPDAASITLHAPHELEIWADPARFRQVAGNLISNAVKYAGAHGAIDVHMQRRFGAVALVVIDRGPGFLPGQEQLAFEPFGLSCGITNDGAGVGLSQVRHLVEAHGGAVSLASRPYIETRVEAVFPDSDSPTAVKVRLENEANRFIDPATVMRAARA